MGATINVTNEDLEIINKGTLRQFGAEDVYLFPVRMCDNEIDASLEQMYPDALKTVAELVNNYASRGNCVPILHNHDWNSAEEIEANIYSAEVVTSTSEFNSVGEPLVYVAAKAYTIPDNANFIKKIEAGLLKKGSPGFTTGKDICSICGAEIYTCEHNLGAVYENKLCYKLIKDVNDIKEWSLVAVPCQKDTGIKIKSNNNKKEVRIKMKKSTFALLKTKAFKAVSPEEQKEITKALEEDNTELSEEDIKALLDENISLKAEVEKLKGQLADVENAAKDEKIAAGLIAGIEGLKPLNDKVKELILKSIDKSTLEIDENCKIKNIDGILEDIKAEFKGLFVDETETKSKEDTKEKEDKQEEEEKDNKQEEEDVKTKSVKKFNSGLGFGLGEQLKEKSDTLTRYKNNYGIVE